jgi:hypothetical protein
MKLIKKIEKFVFGELKTWNCDLLLIEFGENTQFWHTLFEKLCTHVAHMSTHFSIRFTNLYLHNTYTTQVKKCVLLCVVLDSSLDRTRWKRWKNPNLKYVLVKMLFVHRAVHSGPEPPTVYDPKMAKNGHFGHFVAHIW